MYFRSGYTEITVEDAFVITRINAFAKVLDLQFDPVLILFGTDNHTPVFLLITNSVT